MCASAMCASAAPVLLRTTGLLVQPIRDAIPIDCSFGAMTARELKSCCLESSYIAHHRNFVWPCQQFLHAGVRFRGFKNFGASTCLRPAHEKISSRFCGRNASSALSDVRSVPRSRHNPQFNREILSKKLRVARIGHVHLRKLGGLHHARLDSPNMGWRNASFRGFADYMQTSEFEAGLRRLMQLAAQKQSAITCARRRFHGDATVR